MSSGFEIGKTIFWGTNGAIEETLTALLKEAAANPAHDRKLMQFLTEELESFFPGQITTFDCVLSSPIERQYFLAVFAVAIKRLQTEADWSDNGKNWLKWLADSLPSEIEKLQD